MKNFALLDGVGHKATEIEHCQAKACSKQGSLRYVVDKAGNPKWTYFLCDEHFRLLRDYDKKYIARTEGTKIA